MHVVLIIWKGISAVIDQMSDAAVVGAILGVGFGVGGIVVVFFLPYLWVKVVREDWRLKYYHIPLGPFLLRRHGAIPPQPEDVVTIQDYYRGHLTREELEARRVSDVEAADGNGKSKPPGSQDGGDEQGEASGHAKEAETPAPPNTSICGPRPEGPWHSLPVIWWVANKAFWNGIDKDVVEAQKVKNILSGNVEEMHARAAHYDNKAEYMYSFLQVMTASAASFTHGANDVSNAVGPFATIYYIWEHGAIDKSSPVPIWILAFGGGAIALGLLMYGYNIMRNLGNRITLHSPSRGFSMELGAAITVIMATRLSKCKKIK